MEKQIFEPWAWGKKNNAAHTVKETLNCSDQRATNAYGLPNQADMRTQHIQTIASLDQVIALKNYDGKNRERPNV